MNYFFVYLLIINLIGLFAMYNDKKKARKHKFRTPEARLFFIAAILGSPGVFAGMYAFRHKTKHFKFVIGIPVIFIIQVYFIMRFVKI